MAAYPKLMKILASKQGLHCGHLNVNGLLQKLEELKLLLFETKFDIFAVSETHLHENITNNEITIDGYSIIRKDRTGQKNQWGGVLIYHRNHLEIHQTQVEPEFSKMEAVWLEVLTKSQKLLVACIYRPPNDKVFLHQLNEILNNICHRSNILLMGDFNIDLSKVNTPLSNDLKQMLAGANLSNVIKNHTRITDHSRTLIDLAITADVSKIKQSGSHGTGISDHDLIYTTINLLKPRIPPKLITVRNYKHIDSARIKQELESVPWHIISLFDDVDDCLWCWNYLLKDVISDHVKTRKVKVRSNNQPWMNGDIRKAINNRYKLLKKARQTPRNSENWSDYKKARNSCTNLIRHAKAVYWRNEFLSSDSIKSFWKTVKKFRGDTETQRIGPLKSNNETLTNDADKANLMNSFFANVGKNLATHRTENCETNINSHIYRVTPTISNINLDLELLTKSFKSTVKLGKACGADNISSNDLKLHEEISIQSLQRVIKCSLTSGRFPTDWKKAKVTAIHKKGTKSDCSNYRPISLLSVPSKIVEHLVCTQLNNHLRVHDLQSNHQWGFRPSRSTEDILLYMTEKWRNAVDSGHVVGVLFIDFRKAFDSVSHPILLKKLSACGVSGLFHSYLEDYLSNRKQFTVLNGVPSDEADVDFGVPQGSLIGPPSFSINVNDIQDNENCNLDQFADDSTAHTIGTSVDEVLLDLQENMTHLENYAAKNSLTIHPDKCEILILSKNKFIGPLPKLNLDGKKVNIVESSKCVGVTIDKNLNWNIHVRNIAKSFSSKVKKMYQLRMMPKSTLSSIYFQGILPSALYGILIWGNCSSALMASIERIHIRAARFIHRVKKSTPEIRVLQSVGWKPILHYYKRSLACKTYNIYNHLVSPLLFDLITKSSSRSTRNTQRLNIPSFRFVDYKRSYKYRAANIWNNIPSTIREKPSFDSFKAALKRTDALDKINFTTNQTGRSLLHEEYIYT